MKFLKSIAAPLINPADTIGNFFGKNAGEAALTGIPFIGEGFAAQQNRDFQANQTSAQMQFQERMSSTAHQREVEDLRKAGLNPVLSANAGASTPIGGAAAGSAMSGGSSSAKFLESMYKKERQQAEANLEKTKADTELSNKIKEMKVKEGKLLDNQSAKAAAETLNVNEQTKINQIDAKWRTINHIMNSARGASDIADKVIPGVGSLFPKKPNNLPENFNRRKHYQVDKATGEILY